jgi:hypothetical protein
MLRAQISFAAMWAGECAFMVALGVVAFREGGVGAVGAVTAARMACEAPLAPFLATMAASGDLPRSPLPPEPHLTGFRGGTYDARRSVRERDPGAR